MKCWLFRAQLPLRSLAVGDPMLPGCSLTALGASLHCPPRGVTCCSRPAPLRSQEPLLLKQPSLANTNADAVPGQSQGGAGLQICWF